MGDTVTKLTLSVHRSSVENGKRYAKAHGRSLSSLVNDYLMALNGSDDRETLSRNVARLVGIGQGPADERTYRRHLKAKYS